MTTITKMRTPYEQAEPAGKALLKKAIDYKNYRSDWAKKEIGQASKEIAHHIAGLARGRLSVMVDPTRWEQIFRRNKCLKTSHKKL